MSMINLLTEDMQSAAERLKLTTANLQETKEALETSQAHVAAEVHAHHETRMILDVAERQITDDTISHLATKHALESLQDLANRQYRQIRTTIRRSQRLEKDRTLQKQLLHKLQNVLLPAAQDQAQAAEDQLVDVTLESERLQASSQTDLEHAEQEVSKINHLLEQCRHKVKALQKQVIRAKHLGDHTVLNAQAKVRRQSYTYKMKHHGAYTVGVRMLARAFTKSGCSQGLVGPMIRLVGSVIGVNIKGKLTRRTVSRCVREGGVAARLQLGSELSQVKSEINIRLYQ